VALDKPMSVFH